MIVWTDHKPLIYLYGKAQAKKPLRLERWSLRLQPYMPEIRHCRGSDNPADYLSRHPRKSTVESSRHQKVAEDYVNFISDHATPKALTNLEVQTETDSDPTLQAVLNLIETNKWYLINSTIWGPEVDGKALKSFNNVHHELSVTENGIVLRDHRMVLPRSSHS